MTEDEVNVEYNITKNEPIPKCANRGKYKFGKMNIGDCITAPTGSNGAALFGKKLKKSRPKIVQAAFGYGYRHNVRFVYRACEDGSVKVWRVK